MRSFLTLPLTVLLIGCTGERSDPVPDTHSVETGDSGDGPNLPPVHPSIRINEVMAKNNGSSEDGAGDSSDWVELYNAGEADVALGGWQLKDESNTLTLPSITLMRGEFLLVWASGKGAEGPAGEIHAEFQLDSEGEILVLLDSAGAEVDRLVVPALAEDQSYGLDQPFVSETPLSDGTTGTFSDAPKGEWTALEYDDTAWHGVTLPVGFDGSVVGGESAERAIERPTAQSSNYGSFTGAEAVDGDPNTFSHTNTGDLTPWWQVEFDADYAISEIQLVNRYDCCPERLYNVVVTLVGADGDAVWESEEINPTAEGTTPVAPPQVTTLAVQGAPIARYLRVTKTAVNGTGSSEWLSLADVAVWGAPTAPYQDDIATDVGEWMVAAQAGLRVPFTLSMAAPTRAILSIAYDDGFSGFVNGDAGPSANADAAVEHDASIAETFTVDLRELAAGEHVLAIAGSNFSAEDDDFLLGPMLVAQWFSVGEPGYFRVSTPGEPNGLAGEGSLTSPSFDPPRGFYESDQGVVISAPAGASLVFTLDGTMPSATNGTRVDPASEVEIAEVAVPVATTSFLRAVALRDGWEESAVETHTYLFLSDVIEQSASPTGFPATWESQSEGSYTANYEMDPEIALDPMVQAELLEGLREIPTLSIVTNVEDLFGTEGLYANSALRGDEWERRVSLEWLQTDGSTGFAADAKLQIHGYGWRYHSSTLKHSFRIQFQSEYGMSKLEWPMFIDAPISRFDSIVLRAGGSKTWLDFRDPAQAQYLHDAFARDTARDMGKVDGHATYVHLYLNGLYWGLYMPVERPDAGFGEEYFGGDDAEYDAINRRTTTNEAIDGDLEAYNTMIALADGDLSTDEGLAALEAYLDTDDLIDWMLIHQYTSNRDGPCCFEGNNQRGIRKREEGAQYRFFVWDMEYSLWDATDTTNIDIDVAGHASHAYRQLWQNDVFRARYAARAREMLTEGGPLTPEAAAARYEARADEIYSALLAESARWGDTYRDQPYTRDGEWMDEYTRLQEDYFPYRSGYMIEQLRAVGLYAD